MAGPVFGNFIGRRVDVPVPRLLERRPTTGAEASGAAGSGGGSAGPADGDGTACVDRDDLRRRPGGRRRDRPGDAGGPAGNPGVRPAVVTVLLPVVLMLARASASSRWTRTRRLRKVLDVIGNPLGRAAAGVLVAMFTLG